MNNTPVPVVPVEVLRAVSDKDAKSALEALCLTSKDASTKALSLAQWVLQVVGSRFDTRTAAAKFLLGVEKLPSQGVLSRMGEAIGYQEYCLDTSNPTYATLSFGSWLGERRQVAALKAAATKAANNTPKAEGSDEPKVITEAPGTALNTILRLLPELTGEELHLVQAALEALATLAA